MVIAAELVVGVFAPLVAVEVAELVAGMVAGVVAGLFAGERADSVPELLAEPDCDLGDTVAWSIPPSRSQVDPLQLTKPPHQKIPLRSLLLHQKKSPPRCHSHTQCLTLEAHGQL